MSISIKNLSYEGENEEKILKNMFFHVDEGEYCFLIGETGSGKTTILEILMGLIGENQLQNEIKIFKKKLFGKKNKRVIQKEISYVFQRCEAHFFKTTVEKELKVSGDLEKGIEILKLLSLEYEEIKGKSPFELSGGEKRKLAIAIALLKNPKILLLDEPTIGLDGRSSAELMNFLGTLNKKGMTIIQTTHIMEEVMDYATKCIVVKDGEVAYDGTDVFKERKILKNCRLDIPFERRLLDALSKKGFDLEKEEIEEFLLERLC